VTKGKREAIADWLMLLGAPILFASLFLSWSHQFSPAFLAHYGHTPALSGIPHDPTAWQVYSIADVLLALLAAGLLAVALRGTRAGRIAVLLSLLVAIAFTIQALGTPPTRGANVFDPTLKAYAPNHPASGAGEVVALVGMVTGLAGVLLSFTAD
jgi:amino acid transporter